MRRRRKRRRGMSEKNEDEEEKDEDGSAVVSTPIKRSAPTAHTPSAPRKKPRKFLCMMKVVNLGTFRVFWMVEHDVFVPSRLSFILEWIKKTCEQCVSYKVYIVFA
jgi:hypothetical protein